MVMDGIRQSNKMKMGWVALFLVTLLLGVLIGKGWDRAVLATETYEELKTFTEVLAHVQKHYVEEVKTKDLVYGAIRGMLATLDPHSAFMPPDVYKEVQVETKGEFGGVGIQIGIKDNRLTVIAPIDGTPAERAGIKAGDFILKVNEEPTKDMSGALRKLREQKMQSLILDLRNNPGGLLTSAVEVSEQFVGLNRLIVYIKTREGRKDDYVSHNKEQPDDYPIIVLANEGSASASEIVAGALQDWGRAVVVGVQTFGKGSVQTILPLGDGSGLRLTTAKYYTPKGRSIHGVGINPDIVVKGKPTAAPPLRERDLDKTLREPGTSPHPSPLQENPAAPKPEPKDGKKDREPAKDKEGKEKDEEDPQLQKAVELLKSWIIFKDLRPVKRDDRVERSR